ncbi:LysR family transcriptional regulator [Reinekea marinisedimentorum]|uniref:DNA-binding transcriptional LysR family regulator n=1 Tax=Reinekea marinisedimentorum TaxID=230495 RepID=A0A4R3HT77_9GAMM|nr:LysR family transcriptional regulator [Reinekea marinisedimentorum]TCS35683.1 DNA-binding transcriptional LysR family regulator [Reinekea marinisedimentorum]
MLKTDWIETLAEVKRLGSFTAVARKRGVTTMAISKQIAQFESRINEALVNRSKRTLTLTEVGESILLRSQQLLAEKEALDSWLEERNSEPSGTLKVAVLEEPVLRLTLTPWLGDFLQRYPKIKLEIETLSRISDFQQVKADVFWGVGPYLGELMPGLKRKPLLKTRFGIYASPEYLQRYGTPENPSDLKGHFVIGSSHNQPPNLLIVKGGRDFSDKRIEGAYLETKVISDNNGLLFAEQGLGLINSAESLLNHKLSLKPMNLVPVLESYWLDGIEAYAYFHQTKIEQPKVRAFLDFFYGKLDQWGA